MHIFIIVLGIPLAVWICSYLYLSRYYKKWNLMNVKVHETGNYTLLQTIFYFNHFLREIVIDTLYVLCIFWVCTVVLLDNSLMARGDHFSIFLFAFVGFMLIVVVGSINKVGLRATLYDFLQFRELDTVVSFGSHWQMHFLSTLTMLLLIIIPATFFEIQSWTLILFVFMMFGLLSVVFRTGVRAVSDPRWVLHGGREIVTYILIAALPFLAPLATQVDIGQIQSTFLTVFLGSVLFVIFGYFLLVFAKSDIRGLAQGDFNSAYLIASHFFEHVLDYVYMFLLLGLLISWHQSSISPI
ncbi:MAG: hypothetical protein GTO18_22350 [Anaerolineales bacterium]|nr:hypothetical protein [Anaerolineales bacterium]